MAFISAEMPHYGGSQMMRQLSSLLSEDDDDDDDFEQFGSNNQTSSAAESNWMVNGVENAAQNLSSDSEMGDRLAFSDVNEDDGWVDGPNHHISNTTYRGLHFKFLQLHLEFKS